MTMYSFQSFYRLLRVLHPHVIAVWVGSNRALRNIVPVQDVVAISQNRPACSFIFRGSPSYAVCSTEGQCLGNSDSFCLARNGLAISSPPKDQRGVETPGRCRICISTGSR